MTIIEIARRLSELNQEEDACKAYVTALESSGLTPAERMEAALGVLRYRGDYRISITCFLNLYREGYFQEDIFKTLMWAIYEPNKKAMKKRYETNCRLLSKYPYLFRKDFPAFDALPLCFLPFDEKGGYVPFSPAEKRFDAFVNVKKKVITRNFFRDLEKPVLAADVFSQYELEYLYDNVRPSEYVGRENHLYLHYTSWEIFCSWLQILDFRRLLKKNKIVFLIGDEIAQYPIDFQARFGIDYSQYPLQHVGIQEITRLIWHTQLSAHNGGDFFNEIFDSHPNLYVFPSVWLSDVLKTVHDYREALKDCRSLNDMRNALSSSYEPWLVENLYQIKNPTDKDLMVLHFMHENLKIGNVDMASRIAPAIFFQPHFPNIWGELQWHAKSGLALQSLNIAEQLDKAAVMREFPYIKTFTPVRRFTTSYAATVRFKNRELEEFTKSHTPDASPPVFEDVISVRVLNRSFMKDPEDRLYQDSIVVRFEDGKLNPKATFPRLAAFLDLPYTESLTYCSYDGKRDPESTPGNSIGFDPASVYKTFDEYCCDAERCFIEYFMRDAYQFYGYDFQYYDGTPVDEKRYTDWIDHFDILNEKIRSSWEKNIYRQFHSQVQADEELKNKSKEEMTPLLLDSYMQSIRETRLEVAAALQRDLHFVNRNGQPLQMTPMLQPDPTLLERPLYH